MIKKSWKYLITENEFWRILERLLSAEEDYDSILSVLADEEIIGFCYHSSELYRKALITDLWAAVFIARGGCGDDSFHYFRCWLVRQGKEIYYNALKNPDSLIDVFEKYNNRGEILSDLISIEIKETFFKIKGKDLDEIIEENYLMEYDSKSEIEVLEELEFNWEENDEESMKKICPKLFERYRKNPLKYKY